ncbi:glycosyltransferase family 4 protein [Methylobacterium trifolii]|uniref:D-inositol-3-phosphate glycosyltransferase n=1 Tax=Methylobacterium trifolii TaxID=1003092 RepID=A0ABQ4TX13_9HYPH|nr:glycosyltransferase family 1 protein [Methylobacterium trifolii]GJE58410.1 D-inositol-3-phosphate glycosyltransferase [Methylobacterium trifolii]
MATRTASRQRRTPARPRRRGGQPVLYLDPLYLLYGGLQSEDHVMILDLSTVTHPHWHNPNVARAYRAAFDLIARRRPNILAISENTADTLYANYGIPRERIAVVPLYVPDHFTAHAAVTPIHTPFPYVLFVGSVEARKNLIGAIEIFALSELARKGYRLLVVGGAGHGNAEIQAAAARARSVIFCGYLSNEELHGLYAEATAFLYPSYLEGFGVPLLEALHFGVPAVASTTGACPEVGGGLMRHFDPDDHAGFANELRRLVALSPEERAGYREKATSWIAGRYALPHYERALKASLDARRPEARNVPGHEAA